MNDLDDMMGKMGYKKESVGPYEVVINQDLLVDGSISRYSMTKVNKALEDKDKRIKELLEDKTMSDNRDYWLDKFSKVNSKLSKALETLEYSKEAIRLTREYVGEKLLPNIEGWSHYDATNKINQTIKEIKGD